MLQNFGSDLPPLKPVSVLEQEALEKRLGVVFLEEMVSDRKLAFGLDTFETALRLFKERADFSLDLSLLLFQKRKFLIQKLTIYLVLDALLNLQERKLGLRMFSLLEDLQEVAVQQLQTDFVRVLEDLLGVLHSQRSKDIRLGCEWLIFLHLFRLVKGKVVLYCGRVNEFASSVRSSASRQVLGVAEVDPHFLAQIASRLLGE